LIKGLNRKNKKGLSITAAMLSILLAFTGCQKTAQEAPELIEPITSNEAYRPVEYGDIGKNVIKLGSVVPTEYCHFFTSKVNIKEIYVSIGDYVEEGDLIAEADQDTTDSSLEENRQQLEYQKELHEINQKIFDENQKKLDYQIMAAQEAGDSDTVAALKLQKATDAENNRYDTLLFNHQIKQTSEAISQQEQISSDTSLRARHSGYVTYIKDLSSFADAESCENIVIISDYNDPYIELDGEEVDGKTYSTYSTMYTVINGEKYDIEEYEYTNEELATAQSSGSAPYVRFKLKTGDSSLLTPGSLAPLYFKSKDINNVLVVGNDSIQEEGGETFVYVRGENGEKEQRDIVIGESDTYNTEVISGLEEGELVYYTSDSILPSNYGTYTVSLGDFDVSSKADSYGLKSLDTKIYFSPADGVITAYPLSEGSTVKAGDLLFTIDSGGGSAELKQAEIEINRAKEDYNESIKSSDSDIAAIRAEKADYDSGKKKEEYVATSSDASEESTNTLYMSEQLGCDLNIAIYNKQLLTINYNNQMSTLNSSYQELKDNNDGYGNVSVYAEKDGVVQVTYAGVDWGNGSVAKDDIMISVGSDESKQLAVSSSKGNILLNQTVTMVSSSNPNSSTKYTGTCIGASADTEKTYVTTIDGKAYVSKSISGSEDSSRVYYVKMDDESFFEADDTYDAYFPKISLNNIVTIPNSMIYTETDKTKDATYNYVWKIVGDEIVKTYVDIDADLTDSVSTCILSGVSDGDVMAREASGDGGQ
jgi:multidrug efflux pump subunit AcrA (membrane-fusion protein)